MSVTYGQSERQKMESPLSSETSVNIYQTIRRHIQHWGKVLIFTFFPCCNPQTSHTPFYLRITRVKWRKNILHTIKEWKVNCIGHILRRNCLLPYVNEWKVEGTWRRGRRSTQLLSDLEKGVYWKLKRDSNRSHSPLSPLWKRLRTCRKTDLSSSSSSSSPSYIQRMDTALPPWFYHSTSLVAVV